MAIKTLNQKMLVLGQAEVCRLQAEEPNHWLREWNIISITDPLELPRLEFPRVRRVERLEFHDVEEDSPQDGLLAATLEDVRRGIAFSREVGSEPLLIHCFAGISRSTAMAWLILFEKLMGKAEAVRQSFEIVKTLRPGLLPNRHILGLGIRLLAKEAGFAEAKTFNEFLVHRNSLIEDARWS